MSDRSVPESDEASLGKGLIWLIVAVALGAAIALGQSPLAHAIPWRWETALSRKVFTVTGPACRFALSQQQSLDGLTKRLFPVMPGDDAFSISVSVVKSPKINAFAQLGGMITVNSELIAKARTPEELAGVLAHEIGHVQHRDILQGAIRHLITTGGLRVIFSGSDSGTARAGAFFINMGFSRKQEEAADKAGLERLAAAHIDNSGMKDFFERAGDKSSRLTDFVSDHPSDTSRAAMIADYPNGKVTPIMPTAEWAAVRKRARECSGSAAE